MAVDDPTVAPDQVGAAQSPRAVRDPGRDCDLVMKGGVTSGIVYPPAVLELAPNYRFHSIGGTSAGAIAAAVTAAAELARNHGGFDRLRERSRWLGQGDNLRQLFQPAPETTPLFDLALDLQQSIQGRCGRSELLAAGWRLAQPLIRDLQVLVLGLGLAGVALLGLALAGAALLVLGWLSWLAVPGILAFLIVDAGLRLSPFVRTITRVLPDRTFFGLCPGHDPVDSDRSNQLTDWLSHTINSISGKPENGAPLTFGELEDGYDPTPAQRERAGPGPPSLPGPDLSRDEREYRQIELRMMTTNLGQGQPYVLPFDEPLFIFKRSEMARLFPPEVVTHLVCKSAKPPRISLEEVHDYHFLPTRRALPVIFATRLSLSFPILLSAVPLYSVSQVALDRRDANGPEATLVCNDGDLLRNWFSDGGISSNFPIQFFDSWLPEWPTFGINLAKLQSEAIVDEQRSPARVTPTHLGAASSKAFARPVYLPEPDKIVPADWTRIASLAEFLFSIWSTSQNYHDTLQAHLPSYRSRIVQIGLSAVEGGLNLAMDPAKIENLVQKERKAGRLLDGFDFDQHRWVRALVLFQQLEEQLLRMRVPLQERPGGYPELFDRITEHFPYERDRAWRDEAWSRLCTLRSLVHDWQRWNQGWLLDHPEWKDHALFDQDAPDPSPTLRVTSRV